MHFGYRTSFQLIDKGCIEVFGPSGIVYNALFLSKSFASHQSGFVPNYALTFMFALVLALLFFLSVIINPEIIANFQGFWLLAFTYSIFCFVL
jgi:hypothetical protein